MKKTFWYVSIILFTVLAVIFLLIEQVNHSSDSSALDSLHFTQVDMQVSGMFCNGCAGMIEAKLKENKGVSSAFASFPDSNVIVTFDSMQTNLDSLTHAIEIKGYGVKKITKQLSFK